MCSIVARASNLGWETPQPTPFGSIHVRGTYGRELVRGTV